MTNFSIHTLISEPELHNRVQDIANQIKQDYANAESLVFVGILRGSMVFIADLLRYTNLVNATVDCMFVSSYGNNINSSGQVRIIKDLEESIAGKDVLIVEDIIDTGLTMQQVCKLLASRNPKSLKVCTLLSKPSCHQVACQIDYLGFNIENHFVVGYGIDYAQKYRSLPYIGKIVFNNKE